MKANEKNMLKFANEIGDEIKIRFVEDKQNPDKIILKIIQRIYGHKIPLNKFITLLESSPL